MCAHIIHARTLAPTYMMAQLSSVKQMLAPSWSCAAPHPRVVPTVVLTSLTVRGGQPRLCHLRSLMGRIDKARFCTAYRSPSGGSHGVSGSAARHTSGPRRPTKTTDSKNIKFHLWAWRAVHFHFCCGLAVHRATSWIWTLRGASPRWP